MIEHLNFEAFNIKVHDTKEKFPIKFLGKKPAVIDFYAEWCGPCKAMEPSFKKLSEEFEEVDFYKVNVDSEPLLSNLFSIRSIPTVVYIPLDQNKPILIKTGLMPEGAIRQLLQEIL